LKCPALCHGGYSARTGRQRKRLRHQPSCRANLLLIADGYIWDSVSSQLEGSHHQLRTGAAPGPYVASATFRQHYETSRNQPSQATLLKKPPSAMFFGLSVSSACNHGSRCGELRRHGRPLGSRGLQQCERSCDQNAQHLLTEMLRRGRRTNPAIASPFQPLTLM
jgi:hypothetical protein